jgi:16S rRNA (cytidine1402-2'-O)-methyltransferase
MGDRQVVVSREMTKTYEEFLRGAISEVLSILEAREQVKGECTLLVAGAGEGGEVDMTSVRADIRALMAGGGGGLGKISRQVADKYNISRQRVYAEGLKIKETEKL